MAEEAKHTSVARAKSTITDEYIDPEWGPNWEDQLAGAHVTGPKDPNIEKIEEEIKFNFEQAFMMYLPRLCEHCLNPSCVASCPSGAKIGRASCRESGKSSVIGVYLKIKRRRLYRRESL